MEDEYDDESEDDDNEIIQNQKSKEKVKITPEERDRLHRKLASEFVKSKMEK